MVTIRHKLALSTRRATALSEMGEHLSNYKASTLRRLLMLQALRTFLDASS